MTDRQTDRHQTVALLDTTYAARVLDKTNGQMYVCPVKKNLAYGQLLPDVCSISLIRPIVSSVYNVVES